MSAAQRGPCRGGCDACRTDRSAPERTISRRNLFKYGAAATIGPALPPLTSAAHANGLPKVLPAPKSIPGGIQIPGESLLYVFVPGPEDVTLPSPASSSGAKLEGV